MSERLVSKTTMIKAWNASISPAKAGPMSEANAVGLAKFHNAEIDCFESQSDSPRLDQRLPETRIIE